MLLELSEPLTREALPVRLVLVCDIQEEEEPGALYVLRMNATERQGGEVK